MYADLYSSGFAGGVTDSFDLHSAKEKCILAWMGQSLREEFFRGRPAWEDVLEGFQGFVKRPDVSPALYFQLTGVYWSVLG